MSQPEGGSAVLGDDYTFKVVAAGTEPINYQWHRGGEALDGATESSLRLTGLSALESGDYHVVVSNHAGTETSSTVALSVDSPPVITQLTESVSVVEGDSLVLSVTAAGTEPITYQWSKGGVALGGETGSAFTLASVAPSDADDYMVAVSNLAGRVESDVITVVVAQPASIVSQPEGGSANLGDTFVLAVAATGTEPLTYQWYLGGEALDGATENSLTLANLAALDAGEYSVQISNPASKVVSNVALVSVNSPPEIVELTGDQLAPVSSNLELRVIAAGNEPLFYQWVKDGVLIDGETDKSLFLNDLQTTDSGLYTVVITNSAGRLESEQIEVSVIQPVSIVSQPVASTAAIGGKVGFEVAVTGSEPITYQWKLNGKILDNKTESQLIVDDITAFDGGLYTVTATNASNSVSSDEVELTIETPPIITTLSQDQQLAIGGNVDLSVVAVGTPPLSYQWKLEGIIIPGGTTETLSLVNLDGNDAGQYTVEISNSAGSTVSDSIQVSVAAVPQIVSHPSSKNIGLNARLILSVSATGSELGYQWYQDDEPLDGENDAVLVVEDASSINAGLYHVTVTNSAGDAKSDVAEVVVVAAPDILTQPVGGFAPLDGDFSLNVEAKGAGELTYQWRLDGVVLDGQNQKDLDLINLKVSNAGIYSVEVSNEAGITMSAEAEIEVLVPLSVIENPGNQSVVAGNLVLFEVVVSGSSPVNYQWYFNETPIEGANEASYRIESSGDRDLGGYYVVASNPVSTITSEVAILDINLPPIISRHPSSGVTISGGEITFLVEVSGTGPFSYQWLRDEVEIDGAVESSLMLTAVGEQDDADYKVLIQNSYGVAISDSAILDVILPVNISVQPQDTHVAQGGALALGVTATGTGPFDYQWYWNGDEIVGAIGSEFNLGNMTRANDGLYKVEVKNSLGAIFSRQAEVVVDEPVSITVQPSGATLLQGEDVVMWVLAKGSEPLSYQWQKDGLALEGQTESSLSLAGALEADEGIYTVIITNPVGFDVSADALVLVNSPPTIEPIDPVVVSAGDAMRIQIVADDVDGDLSKLRYIMPNKLPGMTITETGLIEWTVGNEIEAKTYNLNVIVIDQSKLAASVKLTLTVLPPNVGPEVVIITPSDGYGVNVGETVKVRANVTDTDGEVTQVEILGGDDSLANLNEAPYEADWTLAEAGMQTVTVRATDNDGATSEATVRVAVYEQAPMTVDGLRLWLNAGDGLTAGSDDMVSAWSDRSLFGHDVSQEEATQQPKLVTDVINNKPAVLFDGDDDMLTRVNVAGDSLLSSDSVSVYAVVRQKQQSAVNTVVAWEGPNYKNHLALLTSYNNDFLIDYGHASEGGRVSAAQPEGWDDAWHVLEFVRDGTQAMVMVDSETVEMGEFEDALELDDAGRLIVGAVPELAFGGEIAELLIYNRALSELERNRVRGYLGSSYGLFVTDNQAPTVALTAPDMGETVKQGKSLLLKAEAMDVDGEVAKVLFFSGGTELGLDESAPYEFEWTPTTEGEYLLTALAVDNRGGETVSDAVTLTVLPPDDSIEPMLLSSATVVGQYSKETEALFDEGTKTFTVKQSGLMRFYRLRSVGEAKLKIATIRLQDGNALIFYEIVED